MTSVRIARDAETGADVVIENQARQRSTYIVGIQGTGKSTALAQIAYQDMLNREGGMVLDPHSDLVEKLLGCVPEHRVSDVIFWNPADGTCPPTINPFYCPNPQQYDAVADSFIAAVASVREFYQAFENAPRMKDLLEHLAITFVVNQGHTLVEAPAFLEEESFRQRFYPALDEEYPHVHEYWERFDELKAHEQRERTESSLNKLRRFQIHRTMRKIFGQPVPKLSLRRAMDEGKFILVNLNRAAIGETNAALIGAFLVFDTLRATLSRTDLPPEKRRPFHLLADEFQTFMSTAFPSLIAEGRKYGVDVVVAHQVREQLEGDVRELTRAVGNLIVFRVTAPNAEALAGEFKVEVPKPTQPLISDPWEYLTKNKGHRNPKVYECVKTLTAILLHQQAIIDERGDALRNYHAPIRKAVLSDAVGNYLYKRMCGWTEPPFSEVLCDYVDPAPPNRMILLGQKPITHEIVRILMELFDGVHIGDNRIPSMPYEYLSRAFIDWQTREYREYEKKLRCEWQKDVDEIMTILEKDYSDYKRMSLEYRSYLAHCAFHTYQLPNHEIACRWYTWKGPRSVLQLEELLAKRAQNPVIHLESLFTEDFDPHRIETVREYLQINMETAMGFVTKYHTQEIQQLEYGYSQAYEFARQMERLGDYLVKEPITTQPETYEQPRTVADLQAELANQLTNLKKYRALCKLESQEGIINVSVVTEPLRVEFNAERAELIKQKSQLLFGEAPRIRMLAAPMATAELPSDEHEPIFGQRKAAAAATARRGK
jgi:Type IV secretion-system coupling protein DNA-binding domain